MTVDTEGRPWDLTPVIDLIHSLSLKQVASRQETETATKAEEPNTNGQEDGGEIKSSLGDFSKIWKFLGVAGNHQRNSASIDTPNIGRSDEKYDYASDGAIYAPAPLEGVGWNGYTKDDAGGTSLDETADDTATAEENGSLEGNTETTAAGTKLSRTGRKNKAKKRKKAEQQTSGVKNPKNSGHGKSISDMESETEYLRSRTAPAQKASVHTLASEYTTDPTNRYNLRSKIKLKVSRLDPGVPKDSKASPAQISGGQQNGGHSRNKSLSPTKVHVSSHRQGDSSTALQTSTSAPSANQLPPNTQQVPGSVPPINGSQLISHYLRDSLQEQFTVSNPYSQPYSSLLSPPRNQPTQTLPATANSQLQISQPRTNKSPQRIEPLIPRTIIDRNLALFNKLFAGFPDDRAWLVSPVALSNHSTSPTGIHVFVDFSNIVIGFYDHLKKQRGIPHYARVPRVDISFHALVLMMERRRPVAKRVLAGSMPYIAAFDEAKEIGYETNILDKVLKAKELTERQKKFQEIETKIQNRMRKSVLNSTPAQATPKRSAEPHSHTSNVAVPDGSGSDSNGNSHHNGGTVFAPEKWVEQAVDEILHLKMMESLVDYSEPSTMVLATGDAAEAEYSQGFLAMAERALKKGWKVELIAWGKSVSLAWRKLEWGMWKKQPQGVSSGDGVVDAKQGEQRFRIIELDDFAEELLNM